MRNSSIYNMGSNPRGEYNNGNGGHSINVDNMMPPMCGTKDCYIF